MTPFVDVAFQSNDFQTSLFFGEITVTSNFVHDKSSDFASRYITISKLIAHSLSILATAFKMYGRKTGRPERNPCSAKTKT